MIKRKDREEYENIFFTYIQDKNNYINPKIKSYIT